MMEKLTALLSVYAIGGLAAVLVSYPWLAQYVHLAKLAKEGDHSARATLSELKEMHPDRTAVLRLMSRVFPLHIQVVSEVLKEEFAA